MRMRGGTLRSRDLARAAAVFRRLLSPLDAKGAADWRAGVVGEVRDLVGADQAVFLLPVRSHKHYFSDEIEGEWIELYGPLVRPFQDHVGARERMAHLGAWDRDLLWGDFLEELRGSSYYNEYIVPVRAFDATGLAAPVHATEPDWTLGPAQLIVHHERPRPGGFGDRGLAILRLLHPAFAAGVALIQTIDAYGPLPDLLLDSERAAVWLLNGTGRSIHRSRALERLLAADPERRKLEASLTALGRRLCRAILRPAQGEALSNAAGCPMRWRVRTATATYVIRCSLAQEAPLAGSIILSVQVAGASLQGDSTHIENGAVAGRFGLTPAQTRVARLLAQGRSNAEIAAKLSISPHTARRHTEQVLRELGVRSRGAVAALLDDAAPRGSA